MTKHVLRQLSLVNERSIIRVYNAFVISALLSLIGLQIEASSQSRPSLGLEL